MSDLRRWPDLASQRLGGGVVSANDEFFAAADHLVSAAAPTFRPATFGPKGQVYDGWETRRRRDAGHDHAIVRLGAPGVVHGVVVDTSFFTGNYPPEASVQGCGVPGYPGPAELAGADWFPLVPRSPLVGDTANTFPVDGSPRVTHVRLSIFPDGGVARLRVHGDPVPDPRLFPGGLLDLAATEYGARVTGCSDMFYGSPSNLLMPDLARVMGDGWETARRRDDGNDWVQVRLAASGSVLLAELDTSHFKGNAPGWAALGGAPARDDDAAGDTSPWTPLLARTALQPDTRHRFALDGRPAGRVRLDVYPDGGMARLRLWGRPGPAELDRLALRWFNLLPAAHAWEVLVAAGGVAAAGLVDARPIDDSRLLPPALRPGG